MIVFIKDARFHAFHGVMEQERKVGNEFSVSLSVDVPYSEGMKDDKLEATVSYADLYAIIAEEMKNPRNLLEAVAISIGNRIISEFEEVSSGSITIVKVHPPISGISGEAGVTHYF